MDSPSRQEEWSTFRALVLDDVALQQQLRAVTDTDAFVTAVVGLATERGIGVHAEDVQDALRTARRTWLERWIS